MQPSHSARHVSKLFRLIERSTTYRWAHCYLHQILNLAVTICYYRKVLVFTCGRFCPAKELQRETTHSKLKSLLLQSQQFCEMFFKFEYSCVFIFFDRNLATVAFDCDFFAFSEKNSHSLLWLLSWLTWLDRMNKQRGWNITAGRFVGSSTGNCSAKWSRALPAKKQEDDRKFYSDL